jgi:hypothetical protein
MEKERMEYDSKASKDARRGCHGLSAPPSRQDQLDRMLKRQGVYEGFQVKSTDKNPRYAGRRADVQSGAYSRPDAKRMATAEITAALAERNSDEQASDCMGD